MQCVMPWKTQRFNSVENILTDKYSKLMLVLILMEFKATQLLQETGVVVLLEEMSEQSLSFNGLLAPWQRNI